MSHTKFRKDLLSNMKEPKRLSTKMAKFTRLLRQQQLTSCKRILKRKGICIFESPTASSLTSFLPTAPVSSSFCSKVKTLSLDWLTESLNPLSLTRLRKRLIWENATFPEGLFFGDSQGNLFILIEVTINSNSLEHMRKMINIGILE